MSSLALVPSNSANQHSTVSVSNTAGPLGAHDAMRYGGPHNLESNMHKHPLENRLSQYNETQQQLKDTLQRRTYGLGAVLQTKMDKKIAAQQSPFSLNSRRSNIHLDILNGDDEAITDKDIFTDRTDAHLPDIHTVMERKLGL